MAQTTAPVPAPALLDENLARSPQCGAESFAHVLRDVASRVATGAVELDPGRQHGKPVVVGTRLSVSVVLTYLAEGWSLQQIADEFGGVTAEQLRGAVEYAAEVLDQDIGA